MAIAKLIAVFAVMVAVLWLKKPLYVAIIAASVSVCILYAIPALSIVQITYTSVTSWDTIQLVLVFYLIMFLQRMLEARDCLNEAQRSLNGIFNNRRINASIAPVFIGLLPSAGAVTICADIVESSVGDYLTKEEKTFVTSYYRHIPESFLPTYASTLVAINLTQGKVSMGSFLLGMLPAVIFLYFIGYFIYLRKVPRKTGEVIDRKKRYYIKQLFKSLWSIALAILLIIAFRVPVHWAVLISIVLCLFVYRFSPAEVGRFFLTAFEANIIVSTLFIMIFKDMIGYTGVITMLPSIFTTLAIPPYLIFAMIFFFGSIVSGSQAIIVLCMPLAYSSIATAGLPLFVLLMSMTYIAMQVSPIHICLLIVAEYFKVPLSALIKKTVPVLLTFMIFSVAYYYVLQAILPQTA